MHSLLNTQRPPVFCPGCTHERITRELDKAFQSLGLTGDRIVMVSDIGCSGLFDTFYHTHAFHGLHGRALTYAAGLKLAHPELTVVVTMGDGGLGIGGAHLLAACRRNLDLTLLILNNFNFGMTGGQFSVTTPPEAQVGSGFLNRLESPMDVCRVARSAGAAYVSRCSAFGKGLSEEIEKAIRFEGFSLIDIWGVCPGRYTRKNRLSPQDIDDSLARLAPEAGVVPENVREEYGKHYRQLAAARKPVSPPAGIEAQFRPPEPGRKEVIILGDAGQRVLTAGEILCMAGITAGLRATQKNDYNITVLRGPSISEVILAPDEIVYPGIEKPSAVLALSREGVERRRKLFERLDEEALVVQAEGVEIPACRARIRRVDLKAQKIKAQDWALAGLGILAKLRTVVSTEMLHAAIGHRFAEPIRSAALKIVDEVQVE